MTVAELKLCPKCKSSEITPYGNIWECLQCHERFRLHPRWDRDYFRRKPASDLLEPLQRMLAYMENGAIPDAWAQLAEDARAAIQKVRAIQ